MKTQIRLPQHIKPEHYEILIRPDLDNFTFEGEESIKLILDKSSKELTLHSHELDVESAEIEGTFASKISYNKKMETVTIAFPKTISKGRAKIKLKFRGILNDKMMGFYRSKYTHEGKEKHLATTQFEATYARHGFPSFDEPALKATFEVSLVIPENLTAISNTLETEVTKHKGGYKLVRFSPTPKMSTYLLAYIVGDFEYIEGKTKAGVKVRVFVTPGKKDQVKFALEVGIKCLDFYNGYFDIPYPLPSMDMIAIPDFAHGAMENWGAVTYRESALLVDPEHTSSANKQWVALVIAHELAHQWFGNLVTMQWWTHLWLNEGFASFIEYLAIDHIFPKWDIWTQFVYLEQGTALRLDSLKNTHPIEVDVHDPAEIAEAFDRVSYSKGASVLRMLSEFLGYDAFRDGLRVYLKRHSYSNAATKDLWKALEQASGKPVGRIMKNWTAKGGYPIVQVYTPGVGGQIMLSQERFFSSPVSKKQAKDQTLWNVPLNVLVNGKVDKYLMDGKSVTLNKMKGIVKLNASDAAVIRVNYSPEYLEEFKKAVADGKLSIVDRLGLVRDVFDLAEPGYLGTDQALDFVEAYENEEDYTIWLEIVSHLSTLQSLFAGESFYEKYKAFAREIFTKIASKVGWEKRKGEAHTMAMLRSLVLAGFGKYGDEKTIKKAQALFKGRVEADLKGVVYDLVAENGRNKEYNSFLKMYKSEQNNQERDRLGRALGSFKDKELLRKTLEFALTDGVRLQDKIHVINRVWVNPNGRELTWNFIKKNWKKILSNYGSKHELSRLLATASVFTTSKEAKDVEKFFKKNPVPGAKRTLAQSLEQIYSNETWLKRDRKKIGSMLKSHNGS